MGGVVLMILVSLQSRLGVRSLEFGVWSLSGLRLDFRLTISHVNHNCCHGLVVIVADCGA